MDQISTEELDAHTTLLIGDCRAAMQALKPASVHCIVTSIPYFGLRAYGTDPQLWGGEPGCHHAWGEELPPRRARWGNTDTLSAKQASSGGSYEMVAALESGTGAYCQLCGAWRGEWGSEPTIAQYVDNTLEVFTEAFRVLRRDGVCFLNIGDSWAQHGRRATPADLAKDHQRAQESGYHTDAFAGRPGWDRAAGTASKEVPAGNLCLIPERLALALQAWGWTVRARIIRYNKNPMPESIQQMCWMRCRVKIASAPRGLEGSVHNAPTGQKPQGARDGKDFASRSKWEPCPGCAKCEKHGGYVLRRGSGRPAKAHEHIWMLTKGGGYYWDAEAVKRPYSAKTLPQQGKAYAGKAKKAYGRNGVQDPGSIKARTSASLEHGTGSHLKDVWEMVSEPVKEAHFATFPSRLPTVCIRAATSEAGCCPTCAAPWARVIEVEYVNPGSRTTNGPRSLERRHEKAGFAERLERSTETLGWRPTCGCPEHAPTPCTVLDFCGGSGTTAVAARRLKRRSVLVELKDEYCGILRARVLGEPWGGKPVKVAKTRRVRAVVPAQTVLFEAAP